MNTEKQRCSARVFNESMSGHVCANKAKVDRDGRWYCGIHDPVAVQAKTDIRKAEWLAEIDARQRNRDASEMARQVVQAKVEMFAHLLAELKSVEANLKAYIKAIEDCGGSASRGSECLASVTAIIAKAEAIK